MEHQWDNHQQNYTCIYSLPKCYLEKCIAKTYWVK